MERSSTLRPLSEGEVAEVSGGVWHVIVGGAVGGLTYIAENEFSDEDWTLAGLGIAVASGMVGGRVLQAAQNVAKNPVVQKAADAAATAAAGVIGAAGNALANFIDDIAPVESQRRLGVIDLRAASGSPKVGIVSIIHLN